VVLHVYLHRESQLRLFVSLSSVWRLGLYEDMHGLYQDQGERLMIVKTCMQTDMGACTYMSLIPSREIRQSTKSIKKSPNHPKYHTT